MVEAGLSSCADARSGPIALFFAATGGGVQSVQVTLAAALAERGLGRQLRSAAGEGSVLGAAPRQRRDRRSRDAQPLGARASAGPLPAPASAEPAVRGAASHHRRGRAGAKARRPPDAPGGGAAQHPLGGVPEQPLPADALAHSDRATDAVAASRDGRRRVRGRRAGSGVDARLASLAGDGALQPRRAERAGRARGRAHGPPLAG